jgi:hypothetical protein
MHPRTEELLRHLEATRGTLREAVDAVPPDRRESRPHPDRWSVAEVLEHLGAVERRVTQLFTTRLAEARAAGLEPERDTSSIVATIDHRVLLDRSRRITAGEHVLPRGELDSSAAWTALEESRRRLRELVIAYDGLALGAVTQPHVVLGTLGANQWFAFLGSHEARHAAQIREVGEALRGA